MYEVEVKIPADLDAVRERLDELHAEPAGEVVQIDTYYDHPTRDFAETDEALRVRAETSYDSDDDEHETVLTYKGPLVDEASKTREETETVVADGEAIDAILREVDFTPAAEVRKEREFYRMEGYTITLDSVDGVGSFVEVEREGAEDEIEPLREGANVILRRLELDPDEQVRTSYLGLLLGDDED